MDSPTARAGPPTMRVVGVMSGTSCDGIDVAVVDIGRTSEGAFQVATVGHRTLDWEAEHRAAILRIISEPSKPQSLKDLGRLDVSVARAFAAAVTNTLAELGVDPASVDLVASHGQTVWHDPPHATTQLGCGSTLARLTGITTAFNFRVADIAAGGQGAPLTSTFDWFVLRPAGASGCGEAAEAGPDRGGGSGCACGWRAVQNIGGIANATILPPRCARMEASGALKPLAMDSGPGNVLIDMAAARCDASLKYDDGGALARAGTVHAGLLAHMLALPYFAEAPPKTTGRELFSRALFDAWAAHADSLGASPQDLVATLTELTAVSIADSYAHCPGAVTEVVVGGGGARNPVLMERLRHHVRRRRARRRDGDADGDADKRGAVAGPASALPVAVAGAGAGAGAGAVGGGGGADTSAGAGGTAAGSAPVEAGAAGGPEVHVTVTTHEAYGVDSDAKEAIAFALLGFMCTHGMPSNVPACTGAAEAVVLGQIAPGRNYAGLIGRVAAAAQASCS